MHACLVLAPLMSSCTWCLQPISTWASGLNLRYLLLPLNCPRSALKGISNLKGSHTGTNIFCLHSCGPCQSSYLVAFFPHVIIYIWWSRNRGSWGAHRFGALLQKENPPADLMSHGQLAYPKEDLQQLLPLSPALPLVCQTFLFCQLFACLSFLAWLPDSKQMLPTVSMSLLFCL